MNGLKVVRWRRCTPPLAAAKLKPKCGLTRISCTRIHAAAARAAFCKESRRKVCEFPTLPQEIRGNGHRSLVTGKEDPDGGAIPLDICLGREVNVGFWWLKISFRKREPKVVFVCVMYLA